MKFYKKEDIKLIAKDLKDGKIVAFPTETVMGLGVLATKEEYFKRLCNVKNRHPDKPFTLMVSDIKKLEDILIINDYARKIINNLMPGEITLILKAKENIPYYLDLDTGFIGVRIPKDTFLLELLKEVDEPLLVPSANPSDLSPATNSEEAYEYFKDSIDAIVEGKSISNTPSTVVQINGINYKILRQGNVKEEDLKRLNMKIAIGSDHGGYEYKQRLIKDLEKENLTIIDCGTNSLESCNYAEFGYEAAKKVAEGEADYAIVICTSGEGISIAANKVKGVRCALLYNDEVAHLAKEHNNANAIAFGAKFMDYEDVLKRVHIFLNSNFEGGRHEKRVDFIKNIEKNF